MLRKVSIKIKLTIYVTLILSGAILFVTLASYFTTKSELQNSIKERFEVITELKAQEIQEYFDDVNSGISLLQNSSILRKSLPTFLNYYGTDNDSLKEILESHYAVINDEYESVKRAFKFHQAILINKSGQIIYGTNNWKNIDGKIDPKLIQQAGDTIVQSKVYEVTNPRTGVKNFASYVIAPVKYENEGAIAYICVELFLNDLYEQIQNTNGLGNTGEVVLGSLEKDTITVINPLRNNEFAALKMKIRLGSEKALPLQEAVKGKHDYGISVDYRGIKVLAIWRYIPQTNWGIVFKIDQYEVFKPLAKLKGRVFIMSTVLLVFVVLISAIFADRFIRPIIMIRDNIISLANGRFPKRIKYFKKDEIAETVNSLNMHIKNLKNSTEFASKIEQGELDFEISNEGKNDVLSSSLTSMRDSLIKVSEENEKRKWATEGQALHVEILRNNTNSIKKLAEELIKSLVPYIGGHFGALYSVTRDNKRKEYLQLQSTYAFEATGHEQIEIGQTLVGQCALEKKTIIVDETSEEFMKVSSGLGDAAPRHLILIPLKVNEDVYGVIEIGSFNKLEDYQIEFLEKLGESIGSTILSVQAADRNRELLESFQKSSLASAKVAITDKLKQQKAELQEENRLLKEELERLKKDKET